MAKNSNLVGDLIKTVLISGVLSFGGWYGINKLQNNATERLEEENYKLQQANNVIKNHNDSVTADMDEFLSAVQLEYDELHILLDIDQKLFDSNAGLTDRYVASQVDGLNDSTIRSDHNIPDNMGVAIVDLDVNFSTVADMYTFLDSLKPENSDVLYTIDYLNIRNTTNGYSVDITLINYYYETMINAYASIFNFAKISYDGMFYKNIAQEGTYTFSKIIEKSSNEQLANSKYVYDYSLDKSTMTYKGGKYYMTLYEKNEYFAVIIEKQYLEIVECTNLLDLRS